MQRKLFDIISARFLHDPTFIVSINKKTVPLEQPSGLIASKEIKVDKNITIHVHFIDSAKRQLVQRSIKELPFGKVVA